MRSTAPLPCVLLLLLAACGGGGGEGATTPAADIPDTPTGPALVQDVLDACEVQDVDAMLDVQDVILDLLSDGAAAPAFAVTSVDLLGASFTWTLDVDGDGTTDLGGTTAFRNASGAPAWPVTSVQDILAALAGDVTALGSILMNAPPGTQATTTYAGSPPQAPETSIEGTITVVMGSDGLWSTTSGDYASQTGAACTSALTWVDIDISALPAGGRPTGTVEILVESSERSIEGTLTLDGDDTATLEVSVDGAPATIYTLDLATGEVGS